MEGYAPSKQALEVLVDTRPAPLKTGAIMYGGLTFQAGGTAATGGIVLYAAIKENLFVEHPEIILPGCVLAALTAGTGYLTASFFQRATALHAVQRGNDFYYINHLFHTFRGFTKADSTAEKAGLRLSPIDSLEGLVPGQGIFINGVNTYYDGVERDGSTFRHMLEGEMNGAIVRAYSPLYRPPITAVLNKWVDKQGSPLYWCGKVEEQGMIRLLAEDQAISASSRPRKKVQQETAATVHEPLLGYTF